ncbi:hypothetical protein A4X13_0g8146 [Tilletia indica]|uniref:Uncharacterized protein n=1 Tax=Tilletia indica TaxID=43049 RepID=A0A177SZ92_9BASI|nr:hypothetical protein A4X13_0g8146 [Tilletia indica]
MSFTQAYGSARQTRAQDFFDLVQRAGGEPVSHSLWHSHSGSLPRIHQSSMVCRCRSREEGRRAEGDSGVETLSADLTTEIDALCQKAHDIRQHEFRRHDLDPATDCSRRPT